MTGPPGLAERITDDQLAKITARIRRGAPRETVLIAEFGCSRDAIKRMRASGEAIRARLEAGEALSDRDVRVWHVWTEIDKAWHIGELLMIDEIRNADRVTVTTEDGKVTRRQPIWAARAWMLERTRGPVYRLVTETVTPEPVQRADPSDTEREADLRAYAAARGYKIVVVGADEAPAADDTYEPETATK